VSGGRYVGGEGGGKDCLLKGAQAGERNKQPEAEGLSIMDFRAWTKNKEKDARDGKHIRVEQIGSGTNKTYASRVSQRA